MYCQWVRTALTVVTNPNGTVTFTADAFVAALEEKGVDVLYDDRDESPGVKFTDAELLGMPLILTVSPRSLAGGGIEVEPAGGDVVRRLRAEERPSPRRWPARPIARLKSRRLRPCPLAENGVGKPSSPPGKRESPL